MQGDGRSHYDREAGGVVSHRDEHGNAWIVPEPDGRCDLCGAVEETRPYGPNGENICFDCGMKDEAATQRRMGVVLFGDAENEKEAGA